MSGQKIYKYAKKYNRMGWITHPLSNPKSKGDAPGKKPILSNWQQRRSCETDDEVLNKWYCEKEYNIGLICGKINNVTVIDFDSYLFKHYLFDGLDIKTMFDRRVKGRSHYYFEYEPSLKFVNRHNTLGIEIMTGNNHQVVIPPSIHADGQEYKWYNKKYGIQKMNPKLLRRIKKLLDYERNLITCISKCRSWVRDVFDNRLDVHDEDTMLALASELKKNGLKLEEMHVFCIIMLRKNYSKDKTTKKWDYVKATPWSYKTLKDKLPSHIQPHIKRQKPSYTERPHNPQMVDPSISSRAKLLKMSYWVSERKLGIVEFHDRKTNKLVAKLRLNTSDGKWYDDNYKNTNRTVEVNETNSAFYLYFLDEMRGEHGLPLGKWRKESEFCKTRVFKRQVLDMVTGMPMTEMFIVCKTRLTVKDNWITINEYVPLYTKMDPGVKKHKIRSLYKAGVTDVNILSKLFGYKSNMGVYKIIKDLTDVKRMCKLVDASSHTAKSS